jgi:hypothetical protein
MTVRLDVERLILDRLDIFIQGGNKLPATGDGKVNVAGLVRCLDLKPSDAQHFFKKEALKVAVNALADEQGLAPVGARAALDQADELLNARIARTSGQARDDARAAAEQSAAASALLVELQEAQREAAALRLERNALEERLRLVEERGVLWRP